MCKRSCMASADERSALCSCAGLAATAAAVGTPEHHQTVPGEAGEKKKSRAADEADGGAGDHHHHQPVARRPAAGEESVRERLKRHRTEMAGRVRIPEMWDQERLLKDWVDCAVFDRPLAATRGLITARDALVAECVAPRRPQHGSTARPLRVQNGCS